MHAPFPLSYGNANFSFRFTLDDPEQVLDQLSEFAQQPVSGSRRSGNLFHYPLSYRYMAPGDFPHGRRSKFASLPATHLSKILDTIDASVRYMHIRFSGEFSWCARGAVTGSMGEGDSRTWLCIGSGGNKGSIHDEPGPSADGEERGGYAFEIHALLALFFFSSRLTSLPI